ncbi:hypothetical protein HY251_18825 [bacterium]|nr:hypothetical protein [bacterium]
MELRLSSGAVFCALALALAAPVLRADDREDEAAKPHELKLMLAAAVGQEERLVYDVSRQVAGAGGRSDSIDLTILRKIEAVDDGLASREQLTIEKLLFNGEEPKLPISTVPVIRPSKSRQATIAPGGPDVQQEDPDDADGADSEGIAMLRRDPDGLARALAPAGAKKTGEEWKPDLASLLLILGPAKGTLVVESSKGSVKLASWKRVDATPWAELSFEATIHYTRGEDKKTIHEIKVSGKLEGAADGSAPPSKEELGLEATVVGSDSKRTLTAKLDRTLVNAGKKPEESAEPRKKDEKPAEKKPDEKKPDEKKPDEREPF